MTTKIIINNAKDLIRLNDIYTLKTNCKDILNSSRDYQLSVPYIYQQLFLYACNKGTQELIIWFIKLYYEIFSVVEQTALRQMFIYAKYTVKKNKRINIKWYTNNVLSLMKNLSN